MSSYSSSITSLKSGSFSCGKSSRNTYFWLQNGPTQFHPDGNLFSWIYFRSQFPEKMSFREESWFPEIIDTSKSKSPKEWIPRNLDQIEKFLYFCINYCICRCIHQGCSCKQHCDRNCEYQSNIRWYLRIQFPEIANSNPWNQVDTCRKIHHCDWCKWR